MRTLKVWVKVCLWIVSLFVLGVLGLATLFTAAFSVGYMNLALNYMSLSEEAELAMAYPLEPGQSVQLEVDDGRLVEVGLMGNIALSRLPNGDRVVTFDRGGGHLGVQGYIYAPKSGENRGGDEATFGGIEGRRSGHLIGAWYYYESTEE